MGGGVSPKLAEFIESGVSIQVGTRDASLFPEALRAVGARAEPGGEEVTVFVPASTSARTVANARDNGRIAVCFARIEDHRTLQLKGRVVTCAEATDADRAQIERYRGAFAACLGFVGMPLRLTYRLAHWPAFAIRFRVESTFVQTPGPGAGDRLTSTQA